MFKPIDWLLRQAMRPLLGQMNKWEAHAIARPEAHRSVENSPVRFEIMQEKMKRGGAGPDQSLAHYMPGILLGMRTSMLSLRRNPPQPKVLASEGFLDELEGFARSLGTSSIGYTRMPERWIFRGKAVLYLNAIVLTMEMDKARIDTAPSPAGAQTVFEIYRDLGIAANKVATYLREHGYSADAAHPLMGPALYPPLAQMAGLGWLGRSGLIITPEHGPRVRLAAVLTSIENLPFSTHNDHAWIQDLCAACGHCIRECPTQAIYPDPIRHENGQITCVDIERCFPYFCDYYGCSVCIKVCPFNRVEYDKVKAGWDRKRQTPR